MTRSTSIRRIEFQAGFVDCLSDARYIPIETLDSTDINGDLLNVLTDHGVFREDNVLGDPFIGEPIQYSRLTIHSEAGARHLVCYNRYVQAREQGPEEISEYFAVFSIAFELIRRSCGHELQHYGPPRGKRNGKRRRSVHRGAFNRRVREKIAKPFHGFPVLFLDYYGPDDRRASKVEISLLDPAEDEGNTYIRESDSDARYDEMINRTILDVVDYWDVRTVRASDGVIGCPHEEGEDYPDGESCLICDFWKGRKSGKASVLEPVEVFA